ncbi:MAG: tyrosine-protein phosphatase [Deltaproteobacteria bacterium]|nr:tyrosine-protein phosphatase [Deltaproteobacteria bacterium]
MSQIRVISVDGASNFRDFGGYPTTSGKMVRWRQLYRSAKLSGLTDMGIETFESLGIRIVIDLRRQEEIDKAPDLLPQGVDWQKITLKESTIGDVLAQALLDGDTSGLEFDKLVQSYADFYTSNVEKYGELLPLVMSSGNRPIDIHCAGGAGRTGFTVALIQLVLGVTEVGVMDDYLLTNEVIASDLQEAVEYFLETIRTNTGQEPTEEDRENLTNFVTMHSEYLQAALDRVVEEYGSFDNFIRDGIGITDEQRNAFRAALLY